MTCRELVEFLDEYEAGVQPIEVRREFEMHLQVCAHCRDFLTTYRDTVALTRATRDAREPLPEDVPRDLVQAVLAARRAGSTG